MTIGNAFRYPKWEMVPDSNKIVFVREEFIFVQCKCAKISSIW